MSKVNVLAVLVTDGKSVPVTTKKGLKDLVLSSPELVKIVPLDPSPALAYGVTAYNMPVEAEVTALSPTGRKWSLTFSRNESHVFSVK